jgi:hypothetical protein
MRTIKFRAWENGKMYSELAFITMSGGGHSMKPDIPLINPILMQFTGLTDKNGAEIYEGDIIEVKTSDGSIRKPVYYNQRYARFETDVFFTAPPDFWLTHENVEIIGNIYQHSQLIEK